MSISKVDSQTRTNCKIIASSLIMGSCMGAINMLANQVTPKDVFQYKNLSVAKKNIVKYSGLGGLAMAVLLALYSKMVLNKKSN